LAWQRLEAAFTNGRSWEKSLGVLVLKEVTLISPMTDSHGCLAYIFTHRNGLTFYGKCRANIKISQNNHGCLWKFTPIERKRILEIHPSSTEP